MFGWRGCWVLVLEVSTRTSCVFNSHSSLPYTPGAATCLLMLQRKKIHVSLNCDSEGPGWVAGLPQWPSEPCKGRWAGCIGTQLPMGPVWASLQPHSSHTPGKGLKCLSTCQALVSSNKEGFLWASTNLLSSAAPCVLWAGSCRPLWLHFSRHLEASQCQNAEEKGKNL